MTNDEVFTEINNVLYVRGYWAARERFQELVDRWITNSQPDDCPPVFGIWASSEVLTRAQAETN